MGALLEPFVWLLAVLVNVYFMIVLAEVVLHWLIHFKVVDAKNKYVQAAVEFLTKVTAPVYKKIKEKVPAFSGFDFSPFILMLALLLLGRILGRLGMMLL